MNRFRLSRLRQRDWAIIMIVLSLGLAGLWYWQMYLPAQDEIAGLEAEIARLDVQIERGEAARRNLPALRLAVAELEADRREFLAQLPRESQVSDVIDDLRLSAADAGVTVASLGQGSGSDRATDVRTIGFSLATRGTFGETMAFLNAMQAFERFTKLHQVSLSTTEAVDDPNLNATVGFNVYVFTGRDPGDPPPGLAIGGTP